MFHAEKDPPLEPPAKLGKGGKRGRWVGNEATAPSGDILETALGRSKSAVATDGSGGPIRSHGVPGPRGEPSEDISPGTLGPAVTCPR